MTRLVMLSYGRMKLMQIPAKYTIIDHWYNNSPEYWQELIEENGYENLLELGSHEGASLIFFAMFGIKKATCVDCWENTKHYNRFEQNKNLLIKEYDINVVTSRNYTLDYLTIFVHSEEMYDLVYVDASHYPEDVIVDGALAFRKLNVGGSIIFDDYKWTRMENGMSEPDKSPKPAIDAFEATHRRLIKPIKTSEYQRGWMKIKEDTDKRLF